MSADQTTSGGPRSPEAKNGALKTALGEALATAKPAGAEQLALLPADDQPAVLPSKAGPGRPAGARNKATEELRAWARSRFGDPGLKLLEWAFADPAEEARKLGADNAWAVRVKQAEWLSRMLPFFWAAMPQELKVKAEGHLAIGIASFPGAAVGGDKLTNLDPLQALLEFQRNQGLSEPGDDALHVDALHVAPNSDDPPRG